ncbi:MAG: hypothetical protein JXB39_06540 [Deltaproteobacteria bacterium]|nr:hypothetical protein [Deltaproteobacteria bacterium]
MESVDRLIERLRHLDPTDEDERRAVRAALVELGRGPGGSEVRGYLESALKAELLEVRWELEEVLEVLSPRTEAPPPKEPEPPPHPEETQADDLVTVYDDPRGLVLHRTRTGDHWFATQQDPRSGRPVTFEIPADQVQAVRDQLAGSPYWVIGAR